MNKSEKQADKWEKMSEPKQKKMSELDEQLQTLKHKEIVKKAIIKVSKETNVADYFVLDKCLMLVLDKLVELKPKEDE